MVVRRRPKKHMYWHDAAKLLLEHGAAPSEVAKALKVADDDRFIYQCSVGSATRTLKCFEYKLTMEAVEPTNEIDIWIQNIQA